MVLATGLRLTQVLLAVACLGVVALGVEPLIAAPALPEAPTLVHPPVVVPERDPARYAVIGERNLFRTLQGAPEPVVEEENLEETKLRLRLLGTIVSSIPERSIASIEDLNMGKTQALAIEDEIAGARLVRVERYRVVLDNRGKLEQITIDDAPAPAVARRSAPRARARPAERNSVRTRARRIPTPPTPAEKVDVTQTQSASAQPAESAQGGLDRLVQSATGQMEPGERVKSVNGFSMSDQESLKYMLTEITGDGLKTVVVVDAEGNERELEMR